MLKINLKGKSNTLENNFVYIATINFRVMRLYITESLKYHNITSFPKLK